MKLLITMLGVALLATTARAETFRRAGAACQSNQTTITWTSFGLGLRNSSPTTSLTAVCPLDAIGEDASNLTHVRVRFQVPAGNANPQCIYAASDYRGQTIFKYILNATVAADGFPVIDFGDTHVVATPPTTTATLQCTVPAGDTLLYFTYDDQ